MEHLLTLLLVCFYGITASTALTQPFKIHISSRDLDVQASPGVPVQTTNGYLSLLSPEPKDFKVVSDEEIRQCGDLRCTICKNYDITNDECVECHSNNASITFSNDYLFGVCGGKTFTKSGFVKNEALGIERCETNGGISGPDADSNNTVAMPEPEPFPVRWKNCFKNDNVRRYFKVGIALTSKLLKNRFNNDLRYAKIWLSSVFAQSNLIYRYQLNVELELGDLHVGSMTKPVQPLTTCPETWNAPCPEKGCVGLRLSQLQEWVECNGGEGKQQNNGVWQLFDDIEKAPGSGVAYVGVLCNSGGFNVGVNAYSNFGIWRTFAHELGHNFNALHPLTKDDKVQQVNAGIMGYGDGKIDGEFQFDKLNQERVCQEINQTVSVCKAFQTSSSAKCGDGIIQGKEECECALGMANCPCCKQCKLTGQCNPLDDNYGCCNEKTCNFEPAQTTCLDNRGYCHKNQCLLTHPSLEICAVGACKLGLKRRGAGDAETCRFSGWASSGGTLHNIIDGAKCGHAGGKCMDGQCSTDTVKMTTKQPTRQPTQTPTKQRTKQPTEQPSRYPTSFPTSQYPTTFPTVSTYETRYPSEYPTTGEYPYPTVYPSRVTTYPTSYPAL